MAELEGLKVAKDYHVNVPFANQNGFFVKGANSLDWGMKKHLTNIFNPNVSSWVKNVNRIIGNKPIFLEINQFISALASRIYMQK